VNQFLRNNFTVLFLYVIALFFACSLLVNYNKVIVHIYLNQFVGQKYLDIFFYYITFLGDGLVAPFILVVMLLFNVRLGLYATFSFLSATLVAQIFKRVLFDDITRPAFVFQWIYKYPIKYVEGVDQHIRNSFPSGHATQVFSIFMCLVFVTKNKKIKLLFFLLSLITAFSRVYLSQHWLSDVTVGSIIGLFFSLLYYYFIIARNKFSKLNKPISALKKL